MQIKNNYQTVIFNGEMGRILRIDGEEPKVLVQFADEQGDKVVACGPEDLDELALAYAVSVYESQGSEFPAVVTPGDYPAFHHAAAKPAVYCPHSG